MKKITYYFLRGSLNPVGGKKQYYSQNRNWIDSNLLLLSGRRGTGRKNNSVNSNAYTLEELTIRKHCTKLFIRKPKDTGHETCSHLNCMCDSNSCNNGKKLERQKCKIMVVKTFQNPGL